MINGDNKQTMKEYSNGKENGSAIVTSELDGTGCLNRLTDPIQDDGYVDDVDIILTVISIVVRVISIGFNINLALEYIYKNEWNYFVWTTCCIVIPMVITMVLCIHMHIHDRRRTNRKTCIKFVWMVVLCPFLFRYYKSLKYAIYSRRAQKRNDLVRQKQYYQYLMYEETDVALIRIFESSLEAAPQKILQISIYLAGEDKMTWPQFLTICGCFGSLTWCIVCYHKYNRVTQSDKEKISMIGMFFQILWHFCIYTSRILCIAIVASVFPIWTITTCIGHALIMCFATLIVEKPTFCSNTILHRIAFALTIGVVFIFTYISLKDARTRCRYALYYSLCAIENILCVLFFALYVNEDIKQSVYFLPLCIVSILSFYVGIVFMILYYKCFHPNIMARNLVSNAS